MNANSSQYPPEYRADIDTLLPALRRLLDDELAAGNVIMEVGHHHPAAPAGVFVMLVTGYDPSPGKHRRRALLSTQYLPV